MLACESYAAIYGAMNKRTGLWLLVLMLAPGCGLRAERPVWEPEKTWVFAVGVIQFDNPKLTSWPDEGRVDARLMQVLRKRGVPEDQILFIKNEEATRKNIAQKLSPFLKRIGEDDTLIFYYAGHGGRDYTTPTRACTFMTYDTASRWAVGSIFESVEKNFRGKQVIYTADCCHSGCLVEEAVRHQGRAAALTSAHVASTSTGRWTFTRCLVEMFEGSPVFDVNSDGQITFAEASRYVTNEMAFAEGQYAAHGFSGGFPSDLVMATTTKRHTPHMGEMIEGESQGKWWKAEVLAEKDGAYLVTWPGWDKKYDEWLPVERTRAYRPKTWAVGKTVEAQWRARWYPARILKVDRGLHLVHYEGFPDTDDEWVVLERLRERTGQ
jgi:hypothetical protein